MLSSLVAPFNDLAPELISEISRHLPLVYCPSTILSLALTCHRTHDIVAPFLLYNNVHLMDDQAFPTLEMLNAKAEIVTEEDILIKGNPSPSHCIHHLAIDSSISIPVSTTHDHWFSLLHKLIDMDGLRNLLSLTLHIESDQTGMDEMDFFYSAEAYFAISPSFWRSLKFKCPNLKNIHMTGISQQFGDEWIDRELFAFNVSALFFILDIIFVLSLRLTLHLEFMQHPIIRLFTPVFVCSPAITDNYRLTLF
jgi:hypothetical protein